MTNLDSKHHGVALKHERRVSARAFHRPALIAVILAGSLTLASCGSASSDSENGDVRAVAPVTEQANMQQIASAAASESITTHIVEIKQFKFVPEILTAKKGDHIIWKNLDVVPHTATANDKSWGSGNLNRTDGWLMIAEEVGEHSYICAYHPAMKGKVIIKE